MMADTQQTKNTSTVEGYVANLSNLETAGSCNWVSPAVADTSWQICGLAESGQVHIPFLCLIKDQIWLQFQQPHFASENQSWFSWPGFQPTKLHDCCFAPRKGGQLTPACDWTRRVANTQTAWLPTRHDETQGTSMLPLPAGTGWTML